jgi:hypothetical protein
MMLSSEMNEPLIPPDNEDFLGLDEARFYEKHRSSLVTPILLATLLIVTIAFLVVSLAFGARFSNIANYLIYSVATLAGTSFISGLTCWLALKLILRPCCQARGANEIRELIETLFAHYIFSREVIHGFMGEKTQSLTSPNAIEGHVTHILSSTEFCQLIDDALNSFFRSPDGSPLEAAGLSKASIQPFITDGLREAVILNCVQFVRAILALDQLSPERLSAAAREYLLQRCEEMDPHVVSDAIEQVIGGNATLVVCWGVAAGAFMCILSRIGIYFWRA